MWIYFVAPLVYIATFFIWTLFHEGMHALGAISLGGRVNDFKPYPSKLDGEWLLGWCSYRLPKSKKESFLPIFAPYIFDFCVTPFLLLALYLSSGTLFFWLVISFALAPFIDVVGNILSKIRKREVSDFDNLPLRYAIGSAIAIHLYLVGVFILFSREVMFCLS